MAAADDVSALPEAWWTQEAPCPDGAELTGEQGGKVWCRTPDGKRHGPYTMWFVSTGEKGLEGVYDHGVLNGPWARWYESGQPEARGAYRAGKPHGPWTRWYESGQKKHEGAYDDGEHGTWTYWDEAGNVTKVETWRHGNLLSTSDE